MIKFFKRIFGTTLERESMESVVKRPDNTKLIFLINNWSQHRSDKNYKRVMKELLHGNSYLILPTLKAEGKLDLSTDWQTSDNTTIKLTSVRNVDGLKALGAFTDEKSLLIWAKNNITPYTAVKAQSVLEICVVNDIDRIVINSDSPNIFMFEYNKNQII